MNNTQNEGQVRGGCLFCRHYRGGVRCDAFSKRIPMAVFSGHISHTQPIEGDHGIQFQPREAGQRLHLQKS